MKVSERWQKVSKINIKSNKLVSVNLTTYNRAYLLSRAIESILKQTYKDIEILIVDDCSTDETEETVNFYQNRYKFIRYIKHSYNKGNAHSRNTAMNNCTGYYVAFMDDDDEWIDINKIKKQVEIFQKSSKNLGIVCSGITRYKEDGSQSKEHTISPKNLKRRILRGGLIHNSTVLTTKDILLELGGFNLDLPRGIDYEFFIRIVVLHNYSVHFMNDITCKYYEDSPNRMTVKERNKEAVMNTIFLQKYIIKKYARYYFNHPPSLINRLFIILKSQIQLFIIRNKFLRNLIYKDNTKQKDQKIND